MSDSGTVTAALTAAERDDRVGNDAHHASPATGSRLTSSVTPSGSIFASRSATATWRSSWPNAAWMFLTRRSDDGS